jgi:CbiX
VTEPSQAAEPLPQRGAETLPRRDSLSQRGQEQLPQRGADPLPQRTAEPLPRRVSSQQRGADPLPQRDAAEPLPRRESPRAADPFRDPLPRRGAEPLPPREADRRPRRNTDPLPRRNADPLPRRNADPLPRRNADPLPRRNAEPLPRRNAEPLPRRNAEPLPQRGPDPLPQRGAEALPQRGGDPLPRRTGRTRRSGRHRSPHRLTLPSDAPTLVLAVPGSASPASDQISSEVAAAAQLSCQGADVQVAYLEGTEHRLNDVLADSGERPYAALAVLVPLLACPNPRVDAALERAVAGASGDGDIMVAEHLGPHPLLAEAMHARLAEAGLARVGRARGLSIITAANGVLVLADRGDDAVRAAGVTAVLLAGRLAAPAAHASIDDPQGIATAIARLRDAGASRVAIAPCMIGPETDPRELEAVAAATGAVCAPPLGAHPAIAQLVAMRYGAALAGLRPADSLG